MMDPRVRLIRERLSNVKNLIPIASGKGGVGKSLIASTTALVTSRKNYEVGLLDLDLHGPSAHVILGAEDLNFPEEDKGVLPREVGDIKFMSTVYYSRDKPSPLRGKDISDAIRELLSITRWGSLDYLFLDMPPGVGNETLDAIQLLEKPEFLIISTPSRVALRTVEKLVQMLKELKVPIGGIIENMRIEKSPNIKREVEELGVSHLGKIWFDNDLEQALGNPDRILETNFTEDLEEIFSEIDKLPSN
ncbi:ATP-binding protein [candidate division MSBL1 archaeon SCGC-AAA382A20]|uniref:ATP-binding protein n=1 Tax=candidate division MSBL1 archaeon SCGC-AAA382A20 TaxID=1698280 RepID=A0A133VJD3_9EURY|nr:ATP-binding protein [candidate division MSBL1 archaeon SCGC-AAA382A20]